MSEIPTHISPRYCEDSRDDALFHYTSADGLIGILQNKEIWSTAYYCTNDKLELAAGKGILELEFRRATDEMIEDNDPLVEVFSSRGVDILQHASWFEQMIISLAFHRLCPYITCFCKPIGEEDFHHGLLSQWRAYGADGGYAIQFSRRKLLETIENAKKTNGGVNYHLHDVHYTIENPMKSEVLRHARSFLQAYRDTLEEFGGPDIFSKTSWRDPIASLLGGPLESLLDYLVHTKNQHFSEERECRLSIIEAVSSEFEVLPTNYFNRGGLIVPYKKTPCATLALIDCIEWIVIGPNPRMDARFRSVCQMVQTAGLAIKVRPSHIPFARA